MTKLADPQRVGDFARSPLAALLGNLLSAYRSMSPKRPAVSDAVPDPGIRFESLEPRILLSGDVNPAALTIEGELTVPGEQTQYEFTVEETHRVVFDSLTDRSDLNWTLEGPTGQVASRSFSGTDAGSATPAFELTPGTYRITIDGQTDAVGAYALRVIDAQAAADLNLNTETQGTLDAGNESAVYRFNATAGDQFFFEAGAVSGGSANWRLIDPYGRQVDSSSNSLSSDRNTFSLQYSGEYLFVAGGAISNTAPVDFAFTLHQVEDSQATLTLDAVTNARIDQAGQIARFDFELSEDTPVLFDNLGDVNFYWTLTGPEGVKVSNASGSAAVASYASNWGWLRLRAGA
ncbi:MAG: LEPR-XLL domain-containing protein, partial [Azoarcus sp.]|nr:LEPR-XLL domain-containing protein [Azoarcus sp.]